jgi:F-type H+-transporting ATPase subunit b
MLIDWFTIFAQLINFLVLVWLLKRFLYKPILNAIDEREVQIAKKISEAKKIELEAKKERDELQAKIKKIDNNRTELLSQATSEAEAERDRLFEKAQRDAQIFTKNKHDDFEREEKEFHKKIIGQTQDQVFTIIRKVLLDLAGASLESQVVEVFVRRLSEIDEKTKKEMISSFSSTMNQGTLRSMANLTLKQRTAIESVINDFFKNKVNIKYEIKPDLLSGLEFIMNGQRLAWSIDDYLTSLEKEVHEFVTLEKSTP